MEALMPTTLPCEVDQRAAAVAGVDRGVGLDGRVDGAVALAVGADVDRPVEGADDAAGHRGLEAERRADRDHALTHGEVTGLADGRRGQARDVLGLDERGVGERVGAEDFASAWLPSLKVTRRVPPSPASSTTWLLVRIWPSELRMMPEPEPAPWAAAHLDLDDRRQHLGGRPPGRCRPRRGCSGCPRPWRWSASPRAPRARGRVVVVPGGVGRGATDTGATADEEGGRHQ